ncbi:tripartite tricarboxylate transporter TctB family protein [Kallotenue papyrolyticum]|uniref:tripartite tricarboxylate transporter TctB family protein n=1 Tax=Kallotenue papyrolyticum TaxID=1325125 RepID=UPI0004785492|nr:tripartite tricarboxylate transporter TctB family protein [Kallotenue papyrolyticum]
MRRQLRGPRWFALALLGASGALLVEALRIPQGGGYSAIGPRFFPIIISVGLALLSLLLLARTTLLPDAGLAEAAATEAAATHWPTVGLLALALIGYALTLGRLGYIVATALFFPLTARLLGSRRPARDVLIGVALSLVIYYSFTRWLGIRLPAGVLGLF